MACDRIVIVIVGEPTSFVDSYALLKADHDYVNKSSYLNKLVKLNVINSFLARRWYCESIIW